MNKIFKKGLYSYAAAVIFAAFTCTGCYSVFTGGTAGLIVNAESTSTPKAGIANVDVYAYTSAGARNKDYDKWQEETLFQPSTSSYGHTTTAADGSFTLSKIIWKENKPDFGKDADYSKVYLLFFHQRYGLTKGETVILSDSVSDSVYVELTPVKKTTLLNLNFVDVATGNNTNNSIYVKVAVNQKTEKNQDAADKVYESVINGSGSIVVDYPRWKNNSDKENGVENTPEVKITYVQSADTVTWKGCYNKDNPESNYAFRADAATGITKTIMNQAYNMSFYGKSTRLQVPSVGGQYKTDGSASDDGIVITMKGKSGADYTIDLGAVTTGSQILGTSGTEKHGVFSGLGNSYYWNDDSYTEKYAELEVKIADGSGSKSKTLTLRSDVPSYTVQLQ